MKKILYIFIAIISLTSCSDNNNDENDNSGDPFVGEWELVSETSNGQALTLECDNDIIEVFVNGTYRMDIHDSDSIGNCFDETFEGLWTNTGNSVYFLNFTPIGEIMTSVIFSSNNTVMSFTIEDIDDGQAVTLVLTYNKI